MTQAKALDILKSGANIFLTGQPGSGKTYTINQFLEYLNDKGISVAVTASTGIAATHIGGVTIHSWSGIGIDENLTQMQLEDIASKWWIEKKIKFCKVLIIDEISMLPAVVLDNVNKISQVVKNVHDKPFGGMQVILVGDLFQLPPVTKDGKEVMFVYKSKVWEDLNLKICVLHEQHRQEDMKFLEILTAMRNGTLKLKHHKSLQARLSIKEKPITTKLFTHNSDVDALNTMELRKIESELKVFGMESWGKEQVVATLKKNCLSPETLKLKVGALVMFTRNNPEEGYVNGTLGKVIAFEEHNGAPIVEVGKMKIVPEYSQWTVKEHGEEIAGISQLPLRLAWAMTVHKSQGMSLDSAIIDLGRSFEFGQGYVALSRVKSLSGLFLEGLNEQALLMHPEIVIKDKEFVAASLLLEDNKQN